VGDWTFVVLQAQNERPVIDPHALYKFTHEYDAVLMASGAKTVLVMTWERSDSVAIGLMTANSTIA
jgi:hypothetical protein